MRRPNIGLITTRNTNIGDDLIRHGILNAIESVAGETPKTLLINKHNPTEVFEKSHPFRTLGLLPRPLKARAIKTLFGKITAVARRLDECELVIQCGAPVYHANCHQTAWARLIWEQTLPKQAEEKPVINIAAGSCLPWERQNDSLGEDELRFIEHISKICSSTTVRDSLAQRIVSSTRQDSKLIPCSAFVSAVGEPEKWDAGNSVLLNYMPGGGHWDWGQGIDQTRYQEEFLQFARSLRGRFSLTWLCHNDREYKAAKEHSDGDSIYFPKTPEEFFDLPCGFRAAVCNRMHAAVGVGSLGIPSIAIGNDTRMLMAQEIGIRTLFTKDVTCNLLQSEFEKLCDEAPQQSQELLTLRDHTFESYKKEFGLWLK